MDWDALPPFLTVPEVADLLRTTPRHVHRLIDDGAFGPPEELLDVGIGTRTRKRIPRDAVRAFAKSTAAAPTTENGVPG